MKKEFDVLQKKIHLHENEIERIQELSSKYADKKGTNEGELKRLKFKSSEQNQILKQSKSTSVKKEDPNKYSEYGYGTTSNGMIASNSGQDFYNSKKINRMSTISNNISLFGEQKNMTITNLKSTIKSGNITRYIIFNKNNFGLNKK